MGPLYCSHTHTPSIRTLVNLSIIHAKVPVIVLAIISEVKKSPGGPSQSENQSTMTTTDAPTMRPATWLKINDVLPRWMETRQQAN
jgi:hypothetical protein